MDATIALLGDRDLSYITHRELEAALELLPPGVSARWVGSDSGEPLDGYDALWVVPGTPYRDDDAVLAAIDGAIERRTPLLGTCGGFQYTLLALARRAGLAAVHAELDPEASAPLIAPLSCSLIEQRRTVTCVPGTRLAAICGTEPFSGFHYCGYGLADGYVDALARAGVVVSAHAPDAGVEGIELPEHEHPFLIATLFQPQVGVRARGALHPLIGAFAAAATRAPAPS